MQARCVLPSALHWAGRIPRTLPGFKTTNTIKRWDGPSLEAWDAWAPQEAARVLSGVDATWCVVGGWAIDLWLGEITRKHEDLEIAILREDFPAVRARLHNYALFSVGDGEVWRLADGEEHAADKHQTWVLDVAADRWRLDVMLEPGAAATWAFRRDPTITLPRADAIGTRDGIPYLLPHCALLFKAKNPRPKDEADFECCLPRLDAWQRGWLLDAVTRVHGEHPWISRLTNAGV